MSYHEAAARQYLKDEFLNDKSVRELAELVGWSGFGMALLYGCATGVLSLVGAPTWLKNLIGFGLVSVVWVTIWDERNRNWRHALVEAGKIQRHEYVELPNWQSSHEF